MIGAGIALAVVASTGVAPTSRRKNAGGGGKAVYLKALQRLDASGEPGYVEAIYTYGAPGAANPALVNLQREDGCFGGLRSFTEDVLGPSTKQVDAASMSQDYAHAKMPVAVLHWDASSDYVACPGEPTWPEGAGVFADWRLHWEDDYVPRLKHVKVHDEDMSKTEPFASAHQFASLAFKAYDNTEHTKEVLATDLPGWTLVAKETRVAGSGSLYDEDPVLMVQHEETLECALAFAGTNNNDNELATSSQSYSTGYCGFDSVYVGYRNELWSLTKDVWPRLRPKLSKCSKVSCVGHGLGGTLCEILAACANSGRHSDADFKQQQWSQGTAEAMEEISKGSSVLVAGAMKKCEDPPCPRDR